MKVLSQIRYVLFALMVLGCFANFAQNEYGLDMIYYSELLIGIIFLTEAFYYLSANYSSSKKKNFYLFFEHLFLGFILIGYFLFSEDIRMQGRLMSFFAASFLSILYLIYGIRFLKRNSKKGMALALLGFLFILTAIVAINGLTWKLNHWPGSNVMMKSAIFAAILVILMGIIKRKYSYEDRLISLKEYLMTLPGKIKLSFTYFIIWCTYINLIGWGIVPNFYMLSVPPAVEKMKKERNPNEEIYWENYSNFIDNRRAAEEK